MIEWRLYTQVKIKIKLITGQTIRFIGGIDYHFERDLLVIDVGSYQYQYQFKDMKYFYISTKHEGL